jgi:hypothetical protein
MPSPPFNAVGRSALVRSVCNDIVHLGNSRPNSVVLSKAASALQRQSMPQPPAFNAVGGRASSRRLVPAPVVRDTWWPRTPPVDCCAPRVQGSRWHVEASDPVRGSGTPFAGTEHPLGDTWRHRTRSRVGSESAVVVLPVEFGPLCPVAQPFECGLRSSSQVRFLDIGGWGTPVTGY